MLLDKEEESIQSLPPLTEEQETNLEKKLVWVLGTPRSGSTWLTMGLLDHEQNVIWNEPFIGKIFQVAKETVISKTRLKSLFFDNRFKKNCWLPILRKLLITRAYYHSQNLEQNIIIKEPTGGGGAEILMECLPNSKLIFLLRDGRDVVDSFMDAIKPDSWKGSRKVQLDEENNEKKHNKKIRQYSEMWNSFISSVSNAYETHNPDLRLLVKYEDLRKDTFPELKKIYDFIGIKITDEELKRKIDELAYENVADSNKGEGKKIRTAKPGGYMDNFNEKEIELMNSIMSDTLKMMGYQIYQEIPSKF